MTFTIITPYMVSGKNSITVTRSGQRFPTKRFQAWRDEIIRQLRYSFVRQAEPVWLRRTQPSLRCAITYTPNDKRTRDNPGMEDAIYHCLEKAGVIANDGQIKHSSFTTKPQAKEVRLEITLEEAV